MTADATTTPRANASPNQEAVRRLMEADPWLVGVAPAREVIPGMTEATFLHSGPPTSWEQMADTQKGAVLGAIVMEGLADTYEAAAALAARGEVELGSAHERSSTGPGTGVISASMAVFVLENRAHGNRATCPLQDVQFAFGANDAETLDRLRWLGNVLGPALGDAVEHAGGVDLGAIAERALLMGDECHDRVVASSALFTRELLPHLLRVGRTEDELLEIVDYLATDVMADWTFESPWIGACKAILDAAHGVQGSSVVTAMTTNGALFGIRLSGLGDQWFTAPAPPLHGVLFDGYGPDDALSAMGDSIIIDTCGFGASSFVAAPAQVAAQIASGRQEDADRLTREMYRITVAKHERYKLPLDGLSGIPTGIDARRVVETGLRPFMAAGIGHRESGKGFIGLGIGEAPMSCFEAALAALDA
jgi:hypothetical protein